MTAEFITVVGFFLAAFFAGVSVGRFAEKIERFICRSEDEEYKNTKK